MKAFVATLAVSAVQAYYFDSQENLLSMQQQFGQKNGSFSPISVEVDGKTQSLFVAAGFGSSGGSDYVVPADGRGYLGTTDSLDYSNP